MNIGEIIKEKSKYINRQRRTAKLPRQKEKSKYDGIEG